MRRNYTRQSERNHKIERYDIIYVDDPRHPNIKREICDWQKTIRINLSGDEMGITLHTSRNPVLNEREYVM